ncbi:hypothetical protein [Peptostreptococcus equinus]|uniref:Phage tail tape measure protein, TP901 family, core region n=1 Tax=Peptostreptococcus equinus TaxID=3003601 RepID=A0ABY7JSD2_9FIRM|nr:hypothetical protein [Peptostreptococcus sp. CBA3647]WAW15756.1 hypothetical protein O0R46_04705 [Peptostreptococcus sp. CBA3647]
MEDSYRLEAILELKDRYSDKMQNIANKAKKAKQDIEKVKPIIEAKDQASKDINRITAKLRKMKGLKNVIDVKAKDNASQTIQKIKGKMSLLKFKAFALNVKDKASATVGNVGSKLKSVAKSWTAKIGIKDFLTNPLKGLKGLLTALIAAGTAFGVVMKGAVEKAATLQQQNVSMEHFMGVGNQGKSKKEIKSMTGNYVGFLKKNANATPYSTNEVMGAGTRALTIAQGDVGQAKKLLTLAEDMAAADPNKTINDAVEALADAEQKPILASETI